MSESSIMNTDRRTFLKLIATGALSGVFQNSIARALELPAHHRTGTIADVEHIIFLMQENRSFDHYFGTLRGVRGFGDPRAITLPSGNSVWRQPNGADYVLPFHPLAPDLGLQFLEDLAHDWTTTHVAWNEGKYDQWVPSKGATTMAYLTRRDIPFHYALADAFTVCDAYYCSLFGSTDPNRYHMWTGWAGNDGQGGGPVIDNAEAGYDWSTYPERLEEAGISWKIYQDIGIGLDANGAWGWTEDPYIGNYGDNSLLYFNQYRNALPGSPLFDKARTGTNISVGGTLFDIFRQDVLANKLPQISWIVAPEAYTEHPNWPANYGAWYVSQILDALTAKPEVWSKTALFLTYDENDGFFDHLVPPTPPASRAQGLSTVDTTNEIFAGNATYSAGPYGLGVRVPTIVISPWSKGGWVNSQVFDHTSLIRFVERRFCPDYPGLREQNITPWRRAVAGDLTSAFDFKIPDRQKLVLPSTALYVPPDNKRHPDYSPAPPSDQQMPEQEPGVRPARSLPYELDVRGNVNAKAGTLTLHFRNTGHAAAVFHVRSGNGQDGPWNYTLGPQTAVADNWSFNGYGHDVYHLSVHGPNGFLRTFKGSIAESSKVNLEIRSYYDRDSVGITLDIRNQGTETAFVRVQDDYTGESCPIELQAGENRTRHWQLEHSFGWYDLLVLVDGDTSFERRLAGHVETGRDSMSDPAMATGKAVQA
jgi:phospholipase C